MRITPDVDIPDELIQAASDGSLVLFVGAGVSTNAPSSLPLFDGLARLLASLQGVPFEQNVPSDAFLGRLCDRDPAVRDQACMIISTPISRPNAMHRAIVRLANACGAFRLVTTNYDEHLTVAAAEAGIDIGDVYHGPAVPLGRNFTGLVHLHGQVSRPAAEMVLTDDDFGRAYLTDGWARTFVQDLFMARTVLFVGYSHNDSVMKYLARGLPPTTSRFALTDIPDDPKWRDLRITPVRYPSDHEHAALTEVMDAWADRLEMGQLDHRARVKEIVRGGPPKLPVEADYIAYAVTTAAGVRAFTEEASGAEWLAWVEDQQVFRDLFTGNNCSGDESRVLASWFVDKYVVDMDSVDLAFGTLARLGPVVCSELKQQIARSVYFLGKSSPQLANKWSAVVIGALRTDSTEPEEIWLSPYGAAMTGAAALPQLRRAMRPRLVLSEDKPWFAAEGSAEPTRIKGSIAWSSSETDAKQLWSAVRSEGLAPVAVSVLQIFEQSLLDAYEMLDTFNGDKAWDSWSFSRSAIEPHAQDRTGDFEDILIDGLRDAGTLLVDNTKSLMNRWLLGQHALFRRLGIHLLTEDENSDNQDKLNILLDGRYLFERDLKHEVYRLLATIAAGINEPDRDRLLNQILEGPPPFDLDDEMEAILHQRSIFDVLEWLSRYVNGWQKLERAIADIRTKRPDIGVRDHPDFDHWMESGTWGGKLPFGVDEYIELVETVGAEESLRQLIERDYSERSFDEPTWDDALSLVRKVVEKRPDVGHLLLPAINLQKPESGDDIASATIRGWSDVSLPDEAMRNTLHCVGHLIDREEFAQPISELCLSAVRKVESRGPELLEELDVLASHLWDAHAGEFEDNGANDWLMLGLNTWPGFLAQYWINRIRLRWRAERDTWKGLSAAEKAAISAMLTEGATAGYPAFAILTGEAYFLFSADNDYATAAIFPLFDMESDNRAPHAWASYMHNPRANNAFLGAGFWRLLQSVSSYFSNLSNDHVASQYWPLLASICIHSSATVVDRDDLVDQLAAQETTASIVNFINALADALEHVDDLVSQQAWNSWIHDLIGRRFQSPPGLRTMAEMCAWSDLALRIGAQTIDALKLCDNMPAPLGSRTTFRNIPEEVFRTNSNLLAEVITHRLQLTTHADWHLDHELNTLVHRLKEHSVDIALLRSMAEAALSSGIHSAASWVD